MPVMSKKKQAFILDEDLSDALKPHLPAASRTTVGCGLRKGTKDYPFVLDLCQQEHAMLVTADTGFPTRQTAFPSNSQVPTAKCSLPFSISGCD